MSAPRDKKINSSLRLSLREMTVFAMFGVIMYTSKLVMEAIPNVHLLGMFTMLLTVVYRTKALYPIYTYVMLNGLFAGFSLWWMPYLYVWTILWGITMLLPRNMKPAVAAFVYPVICALHGLAFGILYAPAQALMFGFSWQQMIAWIVAGLPWDAIHAVGNLVAGLLILPFSKLLQQLNRSIAI